MVPGTLFALHKGNRSWKEEELEEKREAKVTRKDCQTAVFTRFTQIHQ